MKRRVFLEIVWDNSLNAKFSCLILIQFKLADPCLLVCERFAFVRPLGDIFWIVFLGVVLDEIFADDWIVVPTFFVAVFYDGSSSC